MPHSDVVKAGLDVSSLGALYAWWTGIAPPIATTLTVLWVTYCFIEVAVKGYHWLNKKYFG